MYLIFAPFVTDINLSLDDKWLYVSCWGTGEMRRYDVSVPDRPKLASVVQIGGIVRRASHPKEPNVSLNGGPQMVEISRDGKRVYFTNSLYACLLYTSPSPRDRTRSRMPSSA